MPTTIDSESAPGWRIEWHRALPSTQDELDARARSQDVERLVIAAETQTRGRGRRGRDWESPPGGLWFSFAVRTEPGPDPFLGLLLADAVRAAVVESGAAPVDAVAIKWPNDLVVRGHDWQRKWAGILATSRALNDPSASTLYLFGVGANLAVPSEALPDVERPVTSILAEFGRSPSPCDALPLILSHFDRLLAADREHGRDHTVATLAPRIATLGRPVCWQEKEQSHEGEAIGIGPEGGLRVRRESGAEVTLHSNEVQHLRIRP